MRAGGRTGRTYWQAEDYGGATEGGLEEAGGLEVGPSAGERERECESERTR